MLNGAVTKWLGVVLHGGRNLSCCKTRSRVDGAVEDVVRSMKQCEIAARIAGDEGVLRPCMSQDSCLASEVSEIRLVEQG